MKPRLTIAIPTFSRAQQVGQQLARLMPQLTDGVQILVSENGSTAETVAAVTPFLSDRVQYRASKVNRGFTGNFLACIENAYSDWVWILGDDDPVNGDSVAKILEWTSNTAAAVITTRPYSSPDYRIRLVDSVESLFTATTLSEALSVSASVWRLSVLEANVHVLFTAAYSMQPQLAVMLRVLEAQAGTVAIIGDQLAGQPDVDPRQGWSKIQYIERCWTLITLVQHRTEVAKALWSNWQWAFAQSLHTCTSERDVEEWRTATLTSLQFFSAYIPREVRRWWRMQFRAHLKRSVLSLLQRPGRADPRDLLFVPISLVRRRKSLSKYCEHDFHPVLSPGSW